MEPLFAIAAALVVGSTHAAVQGNSYNGLGVTPQMAWNTWYSYGCNVNESAILDSAQKVVQLGLRDVGYNIISLDDCWAAGRNSSGYIQANTTRFPKGMKDVADNVHDLGMKFGIYSSAGQYTCAGYEGSLGNEDKDAEQWASWGVDYLKYDNCYNNGQSGTPQLSYNRYKAMSDALNKTGRDIFYSMCNWGDDSPWNWASTIANSIRMAGDVYDSFDRPDQRCPCTGDEYYCMMPGFHCSMMNVLNKASAFPSKAQPGFWLDLDILQIGNGGSTYEEYRTQVSMWAMLKAPLIMGAKLENLSGESYQLYTHAPVIAIDQDPAGNAAQRVWRYYVSDTDKYGQGEISLWVAPLDNGDTAIALLNGGAKERTMNATLADIFFDDGSEGTAPQAKVAYDIYDLWGNLMPTSVANGIVSGTGNVTINDNIYNVTAQSYAEGLAKNDKRLFGTKIGSVKSEGTIKAKVPSHGVALYRLRAQSTKDEL